jgi:tRNA pseudouridine55 synthase
VSLDGVLVVDKPGGPTSHDIVDRVRRCFGERRAGHTGTLDPFATGVLPVCVGRATRLARFLAAGDKVYVAALRLGFATTTDDLDGEPLEPQRRVELPAGRLLEVLPCLTGRYAQVPPRFSAKRRGGRRLYALARRGESVPLEGVPVQVHSIRLLSAEGELVTLEVRCSPGTYVRALARDLGEKLGTGGHLVALRRTRSGAFSEDDAVPGAALEARHRERVIPLRDLLHELPAVHVGPEGRRALRHGRDLTPALVVSGFPEHPVPRFRVLDEDARLLGLAVPRGYGFAAPGLDVRPVLHPDVVLVE